VSDAAAARAADARLLVSLRCRETGRELKKMASRYGMAGLAWHRFINAFRENGGRGRAGNAAYARSWHGRDENDGNDDGHHQARRLLVRVDPRL
jgi:hypothetical protein